MAAIKRTRYLIKRRLQLKYTGVILLFIFLTAIIFSITIYTAIFPYLSDKLANVYPQGRLISILRQANLKVLISTAFLIPFAIWFGIFLSHKIAGPLYRVELVLRELAEGILAPVIKLRKGDELQSLAEAVNIVVADLKSIGYENSAQLKLLDETLEVLKEEINKGMINADNIKPLISKIQNISKELKSSLKRHHTA